ncbi:hypothetical protein CFP56_007775 [Quercus suber]|uniref:Reverse transcriptase zinc-binding domain-containing protein n=1 Tax=Quercus suber TaxID=58331 RepID=A0AAW0M5K5_QUESU
MATGKELHMQYYMSDATNESVNNLPSEEDANPTNDATDVQLTPIADRQKRKRKQKLHLYTHKMFSPILAHLSRTAHLSQLRSQIHRPSLSTPTEARPTNRPSRRSPQTHAAPAAHLSQTDTVPAADLLKPTLSQSSQPPITLPSADNTNPSLFGNENRGVYNEFDAGFVDEDRGEWDVGLVKQIFLAYDAETILSTPLSNRLPPDKVIWAANKNGRFSVRSAYRLAMEEFWKEGNGDCSNCSTMKQGLETPNKIRNFTWKACHNILATKENLLKRHITTDDKYAECGKESESICHLFWFCDKAKEVWANTKLLFPFQIGQTWGFVDVIWQIVRSDSISLNLSEKFAAIC